MKDVTGLMIHPAGSGPREEDVPAGLTTEVAGLVMYAVGALAVLLQWKRRSHRVAERAGPGDLQMLARLALVGLVILPLLPDRTVGPFDILNPFQIWTMVVLIVGISSLACLAQRLFVDRVGGGLRPGPGRGRSGLALVPAGLRPSPGRRGAPPRALAGLIPVVEA